MPADHIPDKDPAPVSPRPLGPEVCRAAAAGDHSAFTLLHDRFSAGLVRLFLKRTNGRDDVAEDLAQRAWTLVWDAIRQGRYDPDRASLSTFVYAVGNNVWLQHLRKAGRQGPQAPLSEMDLGSDPRLDEDAQRSELLQCVREALSEGENGAGLTPEERSIARWAASGLSDRDVARQLGLAPSTANVKKRAAFEKIRRYLAVRGHRETGEEQGER